MARMAPIQSSVYAMGFWRDHTCGAGIVPVVPNASRTACATDETGFHSAITRSGPGRTVAWTNVFAMNVIGKITMNDALFTTSTVGTLSPTNAMIQEIAYAKPSSSRKPNTALSGPVWIRQPTISPVMVITRTEIEL